MTTPDLTTQSDATLAWTTPHIKPLGDIVSVTRTGHTYAGQDAEGGSVVNDVPACIKNDVPPCPGD
jgi:hypothetical protein